MKRNFFETAQLNTKSSFPNKKDKTLIKNIESILNDDANSIQIVVIALNLFKEEKKLGKYMKHTQFFLINWIIERNNLQLMNYLINTLSDHSKFLMVCQNDWTPIKKLVNQIIAMNSEEYQEKSDVKLTLLRKILTIKPYILIEKTQNIIEKTAVPHLKTLEFFQANFNEMKKDMLNDEEENFEPRKRKNISDKKVHFLVDEVRPRSW